MRRRRVRWVLVLTGLAVVIAAGVIVLWPQPERVTVENFQRVKVGMARAEVEAILGPPEDHSTGPVFWGPRSRPYQVSYGYEKMNADAVWLCDEGILTINYDLDDPPKVLKVDAGPCQRPKQDSLDNVRWRVKRQWHRWFPEK
jgi:hypothetical protein